MRFLSHALGCASLLAGGPAPAQEGGPQVPFGFAVDLVAEAPEVRRPTAVFCLDDGSLLVAESTAPERGRVLRFTFERDGSRAVEVFADGLGQVACLDQIDGDVYALNGPNLTRLSDPDGDGHMEQRDVVIDGLAGATGFRVAMDGFLYVSIGRAGLAPTTRPDGVETSLGGSGIVRLRLDGTELEVFATGTRDLPDLALDERGELFAWDGGDPPPGGGVRLIHVVDGGHYGRPGPSRELPRPALPTVAELGGGAPEGGLLYTDAGWPRSHHGNLFLCEPSRGVVRRLELEPEGATFRVFGDEEFLSAGDVESFRPVDVCASADGRCLYVADRAGDAGEGGRIWRVRLFGDSPDRTWRMRPLPRDEGGLVDAMADPSLRRRLRAQRAIEQLEPNELLIEVLLETATSNHNEQKRRHALWALAELDRDAGQAAALAAFGWTDDTRVQALRAIGLRARQPTEEMVPFMRQGAPRVRREAATALGRVGRLKAAARLAAAHGLEEDAFVRWAIRGALARIGAWEVETVNWVHFSSDSGAELLLAMYGVRDMDAVATLAAFVSGADGSFPAGWGERLGAQRARALAVLAGLHRRVEPWDGGRLPDGSPRPAATAKWEGTAPVAAAVGAALSDPSAAVRRAALDAVATLPDPALLELLRARLSDEPEVPLRRAVLDVLAELRDGESVERIASIVRDGEASTALRERAVRAAATIATPAAVELLLEGARSAELPHDAQVACLRALGELREPAAEDVLEQHLGSPRSGLRAAAARGLARVAGADAVERLVPLLGDRSSDVRREVIAALGDLGEKAATPALLEQVDHPRVGDAALRTLARLTDARALDAYVEGLGRVQVSAVCRAALRHLRDDVRPELERRLAAGELREEQVEALRSILVEPAPILEWTVIVPGAGGAGAPEVAGRVLRFAAEGVALRADLEHGFVELPAIEREGAVYAVAELRTDEPRQLELALGSDDALDLWVAGVPVHSFDGRRHWSADHERVSVKVGAGVQQVVVRAGARARFSVAVLGRAAGPFFAEAAPELAPEVDAYRISAEETDGDPSRGYQLFRDSRRLGCLRCHTIATPRGRIGDRVGPDLDGVADRLERAELIEALLEPSRSVAEPYRAETVRTRDGESLFGQVRAEEEQRLLLVDSSGAPHEIQKEDVVGRRRSRASVMPDGLHTRVSKEEFADLVKFLETLGGASGRERRR